MSHAIEKAYQRTTAGQIHVRTLDASGPEGAPPLICLHPSPYSGRYFETAMPLLNDGRRVVAPDYPGYGGSYSLDAPPSIEDYAQAMIDSALANEDDTVDLLGFHSGCLVAAEVALRLPQRVRHLLLIDAPYFDRDTQQKFYRQVATPLALTRDSECLDKAWDFNVASRENIVPLARALEMFVDQLSSGTSDYYCFHAAFTYDCMGKIPQLRVPTTVIATQSPLSAATLAAAEAIEAAELIQEDGIKTSVFEQGAEVIAAHVHRVLSNA